MAHACWRTCVATHTTTPLSFILMWRAVGAAVDECTIIRGVTRRFVTEIIECVVPLLQCDGNLQQHTDTPPCPFHTSPPVTPPPLTLHFMLTHHPLSVRICNDNNKQTQDIVTRYACATGHHCTRRFGWDCHGLPVEYEIDKKLGKHVLFFCYFVSLLLCCVVYCCQGRM